MGLVAMVQQFTRKKLRGVYVTDVQAATGDGQEITAWHMSTPGDDSHPLVGDWVYLAPLLDGLRHVVVGYVEGKGGAAKAAAGDKRIYARDEDGVEVCEVWLKSTGEAVVSNAAASVTLSPSGAVTIATDGDANINGVTISSSGAVNMPSTLTVAGKNFIHTHPVTTAPGTTGPNT